MQAKLHKAKMIAIYNKLQPSQQKNHPKSIHSELTILKNIMRKTNKDYQKHISLSQKIKRKNSKDQMRIISSSIAPRRKSSSSSKHQPVTNAINFGSQLLQINSFSKLKNLWNFGNRSERIQRKYEQQQRPFTPVGKIYQKLQYKTQINEQNKPKQIYHSQVSLHIDKRFHHQRKLSIFTRNLKSTYRNTLKQHRNDLKIINNMQINNKDAILIKNYQNYNSQTPSPWES